ncbi:MAG: hypothetical protein U0411_13485 [Thermodesulfovibrionales bacterium]
MAQNKKKIEPSTRPSQEQTLEERVVCLEARVERLSRLMGVFETPDAVAEWMYSAEGIEEYREAIQAAKRGVAGPLHEYMQKTGNKVPNLEVSR